MNKTSFETRQKAEDLSRTVTEIWRQSDQSDYLEGLEDDPVFRLLMMALACQAGELDAEIERFKSDVIEEFTKAVLPYRAGHAVPAVVPVSAFPADNVGQVALNSDTPFILEQTGSTFLPLLKTTVFNAGVTAVKRIDGRRWNVTLEFSSEIGNLSGFCFALKDSAFSDLKISVEGENLPLSKPWEQANQAYSDVFSLDTMLYNRSQAYDNSVAVMDLFNTQDLKIFVIEEHEPHKYGYGERSSLNLEFEFEGIKSDYVLDKQRIVLNPVLLVNARQNTVHISTLSPVVRIGGEGCQFLQMVRPSVDQIYHNCLVQVRKVAADRFNRSSLIKLLSSLLAKFSSDFYAFQDIHSEDGRSVMQTLNSLLEKMLREASGDAPRSSGTYLLLKQGPVGRKSNVDLDVSYITTEGAALNSLLGEGSRFGAPAGISAQKTVVIAPPSAGRDEIEVVDYPEMATYYLATGGRIVTPADIRLFCTTELGVRYGISRTMLERINVRRSVPSERGCGYLINVSIILKDNSFVRRSLGGDGFDVAKRMEKMLFSRSAGVYPVRVEISFAENKQ